MLPHAARAAVMTIRAVSDGRELAVVCDGITAEAKSLVHDAQLAGNTYLRRSR